MPRAEVALDQSGGYVYAGSMIEISVQLRGLSIGPESVSATWMGWGKRVGGGSKPLSPIKQWVGYLTAKSGKIVVAQRSKNTAGLASVISTRRKRLLTS